MFHEALPRIRVVSAEIVRDGRYLVTQRRQDAVLPLLWEFPGGRVREAESDADALVRSLAKRLGLTIQVGERTMEVVHAYESYALNLAVYRCTVSDEQQPEPRYVEGFAWVAPDEFGQYEFPGADQATVDALVRAME